MAAEAELRPELSAFFSLHISGSHALEYLEVTRPLPLTLALALALALNLALTLA